MFKNFHKAIIILIILFLALLYPISVYASYYSNNNQLNTSHIHFNETLIPDLYTDANGTQKVIIWSTYTPFKPIQDRTKVILFAIKFNITIIPPFPLYEVNYTNNNSSFPVKRVSYIGTLTQFNLNIFFPLKKITD